MHSYSVNSKHRKMKFDQIRDLDPLRYNIFNPATPKIKEPTHAYNKFFESLFNMWLNT